MEFRDKPTFVKRVKTSTPRLTKSIMACSSTLPDISGYIQRNTAWLMDWRRWRVKKTASPRKQCCQLSRSTEVIPLTLSGSRSALPRCGSVQEHYHNHPCPSGQVPPTVGDCSQLHKTFVIVCRFIYSSQSILVSNFVDVFPPWPWLCVSKCCTRYPLTPPPPLRVTTLD